MSSRHRNVPRLSVVRVLSCVVAFLGFCAVSAPTVRADVVGEEVVYGNVRFVRQGDQIFIYAGDNSVINYQAFDIGVDQLVQFFQPGADSRVLNRILGATPTRIDGTLLANGRVYFANPAGVIFGPNSIINVGGIYAAAANISNADFLQGVDQFTDASGAVVNYGSIQAEAVHLFGERVANHGAIVAPGGIVTMLAGDSAFIGEVGGNLLVRVDGRTLTGGQAPADGSSAPDVQAGAGVLNTGSVSASSGKVMLGAGDLYSLGIHNVGSITAEAGEIALQANDGAIYNQGDISADVADGQAGSVIVQAPNVVNSGHISADAIDGQAGYVEVTSQRYTYLLNGSSISAAGLGSATGGEVLIHSYQGLTFFSAGALVDVSGGPTGGDGGFAEVSGYSMRFFGDVDLTAPAGTGGTLLIDPENIRIVESEGPPNDNNELNDGEVLFSDDLGNTTIIEAGKVSQVAQSNTTILLEATNNITIEFEIDLDPADANEIVLNAGNDIIFLAPIIDAGSIVATADADFLGFPADGIGDIIIAVDLTTLDGMTFNGDVFLTAIGNQTLDGGSGFLSFSDSVVKTGIGTMTLATTEAAANAITVGGNITANFGAIDLQGNVSLTDAGAQSITALNTITTGDDVVKATGDLTIDGNATLGGDVEATAGSLTFSGTADFNAGGNQNAVAGTTLSVPGNITKSGGGTLNLQGNLVDLDGTITGIGGTSLTVTGVSQIAGDITAEGDLTFTNNVTFDGAATDQTAGAGGTIDANGAVDKINGGNLTLDGDAMIAGNVSSTGDLVLAGDVTFDGAAVNQMASAGGTIDADGSLAKIGGGNLLIASAATVGGDVTSTGDLTFATPITFDGAGDQLASAGGTMTFTSTATKTTTGNLNVNGDTFVDLNGAVVVQDGDFASTGGLFDNTGSPITADNISIDHDANLLIASDLTATGAIVLHAGNDDTGNLSFAAGLTLQGDDITVRAGDGLAGANGAIVDFTNAPDFLGAGGAGTSPSAFTWRQDAQIDNGLFGPLPGDFGGGVASMIYTIQSDANNVIINNAGRVAGTNLVLRAPSGASSVIINPALNLESLIASAGNVIDVNSTVTTNDDLELQSPGLVEADLIAGGDMTVGQVTLGGVGNQLMMAGGGLNALGNVVKATAGNLTLDGLAVNLDGSLTQVAGGNLILNGPVAFGGGGNQSAVASNTIDASDNVIKGTVGNLTLSAAGINLGGATTQAASGDLVLNGATAFDGAGNQTAMADGTLDINGNAVKTSAGNLTLDGSNVALAGATTEAAGGDLVVNGTTDFNGAGNQIARASGLLDVNNAATKSTAGDLDLVGTSVQLAGVNVSGGTLEVTGTASSAGNVAASNEVTFFDNADVTGNVTATAGDVAFVGTAAVTGNVTAGQGVGFGDAANVDGDVVANSGSVDFAATSNVGGNVNAFGGDVTFGDDVTFDGVGTQTAHADGILTADGAVTKSTAGTLNLDADNVGLLATAIRLGDGANDDTVSAIDDLNITAAVGNVDINHNVDVTNGSATIGGNAFLAGNISAGGDLMFLNAVTFEAVGQAQSAIAGGSISATGAVIRDNAANNGNLTLQAGTTIDLDSTATANNDLTMTAANLDLEGNVTATSGALDITGTTNAAGNLTAGTALGVSDALALDGLGAQTLNAGGAMDLGGTVTKSNSNLTLTAGGGIDLGDDLTVSAGNLTVNDALAVNGGGNVTTSGTQLFQDTLTLNVDTTLASTAGADITLNGAVAGGVNDLAINTAGITQINNAVTAATFTTDAGGETRLNHGGGAVVSTGGNQTYGDQVFLQQAGLLNAGGTVAFNDNVIGDALTIDASGQALLGDDAADFFDVAALDVDADGGIQMTAGSITTALNQRYRDAVMLNNDITLTSTGNGSIWFDGMISGDHDLAVATGGNTIFDDTVDIAMLQTDAGGETHINTASMTTSGDQLYGDLVVLGTDVNFDAGNDLTFDGGIAGIGRDVVANATGATTFRNLVELDGLEVVGVTRLDGAIETAGDMIFGADILLVGDSKLTNTSAGGFTLDVDIEGPFAIGIRAVNGLTINGRLGTSGARLGSIALSTDDVLVINIDSLYAMNGIALNADGRADVPAFATIVAPNGDILFDTVGGNFLMGQNEKMTVFGTADIQAPGGLADLSDINTLNDLIVNAGQIFLLTRDPGFLLDRFGNLTENPDLGVDFVAGGDFIFSVTPNLKGGGVRAFFSSPGGVGDVNGKLNNAQFVRQSFEGTITELDLMTAAGVDPFRYLDLKADGPTTTNVSEALAAALPRESDLEEVPQETPVSSSELDVLRQLGIDARRLLQSEYIRNQTLPAAVFNDSKSFMNQLRQIDNKVTEKRLLNERVRGVVRKYNELIGVAPATEAEEGEAPPEQLEQPVDRRAVIRDLLIEARADFAEQYPDRDMSPAAFKAFLREPAYQEVRRYFEQLESLLADIRLLGLTQREYREVETYLLKDIESTFIDTEYLRSMLLADNTVPADAP